MKVAIVLNGRAGPSRRRTSPGEVEARARAVLTRLGAEPVVLTTQGPGHARDLARQAVELGAGVVCAWGGDGTVNEVASGLVFGRGVLAVVPAGSGNGFARDLGIPLDLDAALAVAVDGATRVLDAGEINGRLFVNVSGFGFDAMVARVFAEIPRGSRGLSAYLRAGLKTLFRYRAQRCTVSADGEVLISAPICLVALANTRQWGNGALIAPGAVPDDGLLDLVVVEGRSPLSILVQAWRLRTGSIARAPGVTMRAFREADIVAAGALPLHIDGEPAGQARVLHARVLPRALSVKVPAL